MALYHKYRPRTFRKFVGNKSTVRSLKELFKRERESIPHAFLFHGPTGCGKTTLARIVSKMLGCKGADYIESDSADYRGIDTIRAIRRNMNYAPLEGKCRVWVLDECHQLSIDAQNALLKALEDTPNHVYFILCTTDPQKLLSTIRGRCHQYELTPLTDSQMRELLNRVIRSEKKEVPESVLEQIIIDSMGRPRNSLQILDKVLDLPQREMLEAAKQEAAKEAVVIDLCRALVSGKGSWKKISKILGELKEKNENPESVRLSIYHYCGAVLLRNDRPDLAVIMDFLDEPVYSKGFAGLVHGLYSAFLELKN